LALKGSGWSEALNWLIEFGVKNGKILFAVVLNRSMAPKLQFPIEFQNRLRRIVPAGIISNVNRAYVEGQPITGRVNTLKSSIKDVVKSLAQERIEIVSSNEIPEAFVVIKGNFKKLTDTDCYQKGWIYLQSLSSQIPPFVLDPKPGDRVLDMCASPGGKTTQMAALMQNQGEMLACEPEQRRFERLESNVKKQGASIVRCIRLDALKLNLEQNGLFDKILLDAPCSSEGTFLLNEPPTWQHWSLGFIEKQAALQKRFLQKAIELLKEGGTLVYSTCALSPEENEGVLDFIVTNFPEMNLIEIASKFNFLKPPLTQWGGQAFSPQVSQARRIYPSVNFEGFFVGKLIKK
ncbi:MAG: RNA methylase, NOL1/NOP2/sun family, partial [uncultured bacterium]